MLNPSPSHATWHKRIIGLIDRGAQSARSLPGAAAAELEPALRRARAVLESLSPDHRDGLLLLSAARIHIESAQRLCRTLMLGDVLGKDHLTSEQMSQLVQLRQMCLEVIPLLNDALASARRRRM